MPVELCLSFMSQVFLDRLRYAKDQADRHRIIYNQVYLEICHNLAIGSMLNDAAYNNDADNGIYTAINLLEVDGLLTAATELPTDKPTLLQRLSEALISGLSKASAGWVRIESDDAPIVDNAQRAIWHLALKTRELKVAASLKMSMQVGVRDIRIATRFRNLLLWLKETESIIRHSTK